MSKIIIEPRKECEALIQFSNVYDIKKNLFISVPSQYQAVAFIDEKASFRVEPCVKKSIVKEYGKELINKQVKFAFFVNKAIEQIRWGFGNIDISNTELNEMYKVGANGKCLIKIDDYIKLISAFSINNEITTEKVREKTLSIIQTIGKPLLANYINDKKLSAFEITNHISEIREIMTKELSQNTTFASLGLIVSDVTVDGIFINPDDLERIRKQKAGE